METYFTKIDQNPYQDLAWNIPDQKQGSINLFGGNSQSFNFEIRTAEALTKNFPIKDTKIFLPDSLKNTLPPLENLVFLPSTESGSLAESEALVAAMNEADFNLILGDLSKNSITTNAIVNASTNTTKPTLIIRDAVDLIASANPELLLMNDNVIIFATTAQLQKLFNSVYYPKVITMSQSLMQIAEALHKFTLSYAAKLIVLNNGQLLLAENGEVTGIPLETTKYSPITLWTGELTNKIAAMNLYNPNNFKKATISAIF